MAGSSGAAGRQNPFILSYSDLMAALLLVFILLLTTTLFLLQDEVDRSRDQAKRITIIKDEIIQKLREEFAKKGVEIEVDPLTGAIKLDSDVLFDTGSSVLRPEGRARIDALLPIYFNVLLAPEYKSDVRQIIVEGHTDPRPPRANGSFVHGMAYIYNLGLSQDRSRSVVAHVLDVDFSAMADSVDLPNLRNARRRLKGLLTANGMSFSRPIGHDGKVVEDVPYEAIEAGGFMDTEATIDFDRSRRVEFKFRLNDEEYLRQIRDILQLGGKADEP